MPPPSEPAVWTEEMYTSDRSYLRYSTGASPPAFLTDRVAVDKCLPVQQARKSPGEALSTCFMTLRSERLARLEPEPRPMSPEPVLVTPKENERISISF